MAYTGGELERRQPDLPGPYHYGQHGQHARQAAPPAELRDVATLIRKRRAFIFGLILIGLSLIWKGIFLSHYYFWQDDFHFLELALSHPMDYKYLTLVGAGHLFPAVYAIIWVFARVALYSWGAATALILIALALSGLAALRLLRTLFGDRPAILVPLVIYLVSPLTMPDIRWWSAALETIPFQAALFMALDAQVHYVRTGRFRHGVAAAAWVVVGLLFFEKALVLPALLFGVTSAFLLEGPWLRTIGQCLVRYWKAWVLQLVVLGAYAVVLKEALRTSSVQPGIPGSSDGVFTFVQELVKDTFIPGSIGGPWQWFVTPDKEYAYSAPPNPLVWLSLLVAAAVVVASIAMRRYAWRAWAILAAWLVAADMVPVLIGRISETGAGVFGLETRYVADAVPVLAICLGLAFWPVDGKPDFRSRRWVGLSPNPQAGRMVAAGLVGAFLIGSVWSVQAFTGGTSSLPDQIYLENAIVAVSEAPPGTVIYDTPVSPSLMLGVFGQFAMASAVVGPTESPAAKAAITWTTKPDGTIGRLMVFGPDGRLHTAGIFGQPSQPLPDGKHCQTASQGQVVVRFAGKVASGSTVLRVAYLASRSVSGQSVTLRYGDTTRQLTLETGLHDAYVPIRGSASSVVVSGAAAAGAGLCIGDMSAGIIAPSPTGLTIPSAF